MNKKYDCIVVGAGPMGIFCAYELIEKGENLNILVIDKGSDIYHRHCPILDKKIKKCPVNSKGELGCSKGCAITTGFGGSGAYSDGKFNITSEFGGWMTNYLEEEEVLNLIRYVDSINVAHGATKDITNPTTKEVKEIERRAIGVGLKLLRSNVRHLGTEENIKILQSIYEYMKPHADFLFNTKVENILVEGERVTGITLQNGETIEATNVILGVGREGSEWLMDTLKPHKIAFKNNQVDIGVRVETNDIVMEEINEHLYEGKFIFNTSVGTSVRTFCSNPSGYVVIENHNGTVLCNGHAFSDRKLGSNNTNFALLVSHEFGEPFDDPNDFAHEVAKLANKLSGGSVMVQTYGDILRGRRSTPKRLKESFVKPTLKEAVPGDLGLVLPYNTMKSLIEMTEALDHVTPGIASDHTLFYGVEAKFYSAKPETNQYFETKIKNLYVGGDGAGITRGLAQAGANGVWIARHITDSTKRA